MHARGFMVGTKIDLRQSATGTNSSALRWHCGTGVTKAAAHYALTIQPGETEVIRLRLAASEFRGENAFANFAKIFALRQREADEFYATLIPQDLSDDDQNLMRQVSLACCGPSSSTTMWSKTGRSVTPETHLRLRNARRDVIASGRTSITPMSSRCPTNGNTHGTWMAMYTL